MKFCPVCEQTLPRSAFYRSRRERDGLQHRCKACKAAYNAANRDQIRERQRTYVAAKPHVERNAPMRNKKLRMRGFGLTVADYDAMVLAQGGVCAICNRPETAKHFNGTTRSLSVDHDHQSGVVRGLLCGRCNRALGLFSDDPERLRAAALYLDDSRASMDGRFAAKIGGH